MTDVQSVAVTGAAGLLGQHVCRSLLGRGATVQAMVHRGSDRTLPADLAATVQVQAGDVGDTDSLERAFAGVDAVVHCAARVIVETDPEGLADATNAAGTANVIEACVASSVSKLVHVGSVHAFGPLRGIRLHRNSPLALGSRIPYCASKAMAHQHVLQEAAAGRLDATVVCPGALVGPGDTVPTPVGEMLLQLAAGRIPCFIDEGYWWSDPRDVAEVVASAAGHKTNQGAGRVYFTLGRFEKLAGLARLCSRILGRNLERPVVPVALAFAGLPFLQLYAALRRQPPLYTRNSLHLVCECPADVDHEVAEMELGYVRRPLEHSVRDALHSFQDRGMLA